MLLAIFNHYKQQQQNLNKNAEFQEDEMKLITFLVIYRLLFDTGSYLIQTGILHLWNIGLSSYGQLVIQSGKKVMESTRR